MGTSVGIGCGGFADCWIKWLAVRECGRTEDAHRNRRWEMKSIGGELKEWSTIGCCD